MYIYIWAFVCMYGSIMRSKATFLVKDKTYSGNKT